MSRDSSVLTAEQHIMSIRVREARESDCDALASLWQQLDEAHQHLHPGFFRAAPARLTEPSLRVLLRDPHRQMLVAEVEARVAGAVKLQLYDAGEKPGTVACRRAYVEDLVVDITHRRSGVARRLMREAERWSRAQGGEQMVLTAWTGNEAARHLYEELGYREVSRVLVCDLPPVDTHDLDG